MCADGRVGPPAGKTGSGGRCLPLDYSQRSFQLGGMARCITGVVDFVHVSWFPGIFNVADSAITVGVLMLAGYLLLLGESGAVATRQQPADEALLGELLGQDQWRSDR